MNTEQSFTDSKETAEIQWWDNMRVLLQSDPTDADFRQMVRELWSKRPGNLAVMDTIAQNGLHEGTTVGEHERRVLLRLQTDHLSNGDAMWARIVALGHDHGKKDDPEDPLHPLASALGVDDHMHNLGIDILHRELLHELIAQHHFWGDVVLGRRLVEEAPHIFPDINAVMISHAVARADVGSIDSLRRDGAILRIDQAADEALKVNGFGGYYTHPGKVG